MFFVLHKLHRPFKKERGEFSRRPTIHYNILRNTTRFSLEEGEVFVPKQKGEGLVVGLQHLACNLLTVSVVYSVRYRPKCD